MNSDEKLLILFDGECNLCNGWVQFVISHDPEDLFRFASFQSPAGRRVSLENGIDPDDLKSFFLLSRGNLLFRSDAAIEVVIQFGGFWRLFGGLLLIPKLLRDWIYSLVARNRYRLFGKRETCLMPTPELASRFLSA